MVYVFFYVLYYYLVRGLGRRLLSFACKTNQADFTCWMSFLPSNFIQEISPYTEAFGKYLKSLISMGKLKNSD